MNSYVNDIAMNTMDSEIQRSGLQSRRAKLADFIARRSTNLNFRLHDWLRTLDTEELKQIEMDARNCCHNDRPEALSEVELIDLVDAALMAYVAERSFEITREDALDCLDDLLVGLSVVACVERLERAGWVTVVEPMSILVANPRPYWVTYKGLKDGVWSNEPLTLWLLGVSLEIH